MKQYIPLGEVITKATVERCGGNQFPILSITMKDGLVLQDEKFKKRIASVDTSDYKVIPRGKLVQGIHIDEANFGIQDIVDAGIVSPAYKVWDVNDRRIFPKYLEIIMRSPRSIGFYKSKLNGSVNRRGRMTDDDFLGMLIPVVDYSEQIRIVDILNRVKVVITKREHELSALDDLIKARFVEMFGDPMVNPKGYDIKPYRELFELNAGGTPSKTKPEYWENGTISWIGSNLCQNVILYENDGKYISQEGYDHSSARIFPIDTVLIALVGATIGKTALLKFETSTNQNVLGVRHIVESGYNPVFVYYYTQFLYQKFMNIGDGGFNMASKGFVSELPIYDIDISAQNEFAAFAEQVDKSKSVIQKSLEKTQILFDSLIQQYFG